MKTTYYSVEQLPLVMNVEEVGSFLSISRAGAYALFHRSDFPCIKINKRMLVEREKFLAWLSEQS